jgi:DNA-binding GntR family transcriptional regulator
MQVKTVADQVADLLRNDILSGALPPGTRLLQDEEAARLQVSRTPVREAFRQLEAERLVQIIPHRGAIVIQLSAAEIREIYLIRSELEALAAAEAARNASSEDIEAIGRLLKDLEYAYAKARLRTLLDLNRSFHFMIYEASGHQRLVNMIASLWGPIEATRAAYVSEPLAARHAMDEHLCLYQAVKARDSVQAARITRRHLKATADALLERLRGREVGVRLARPAGAAPSPTGVSLDG